MKSMLLGVAALGVGGAYYLSDSSDADFDRVINRPHMSVYAAFSHAAQEGPVVGRGRNGFAGRTVARIRKERGELIHYELLNEDNQPVMTAELRFAPEGENATRMTAELDIDPAALGAHGSGEAALAALTESFVDAQFASLLEELAADVEKGRTLQPLPLTRILPTPDSSRQQSAEQRMYDAQRAQRAAARPMTDAAPMVDPNAAARQHVRSGGQPAPSGGWGH